MIFDTPLKRRRPFGGGNAIDDLDLDALTGDLPDVEEAEAEIEAALKRAAQQLKEEESSSGCECW